MKVKKKQAVVCKEKKNRISSLHIAEGETIPVESPASGSLGWGPTTGQEQWRVRTSRKISRRAIPHPSHFPRTDPIHLLSPWLTHAEKKRVLKNRYLFSSANAILIFYRRTAF